VQYRHIQSFQVQSGSETLCQQTFAIYLLTVSRPVSTVCVSFEHRTTSCFYHLHCFYPKLLSAARLSRYTSAYSLAVPLSEDASASWFEVIKWSDMKLRVTWQQQACINGVLCVKLHLRCLSLSKFTNTSLHKYNPKLTTVTMETISALVMLGWQNNMVDARYTVVDVDRSLRNLARWCMMVSSAWRKV